MSIDAVKCDKRPGKKNNSARMDRLQSLCLCKQARHSKNGPVRYFNDLEHTALNCTFKNAIVHLVILLPICGTLGSGN